MAENFLRIEMANATPEGVRRTPLALFQAIRASRTWNVEEREGGLYAGIWEATPASGG